MTRLDKAIVRALGLDPAFTTTRAHGGSGFASTMKIETRGDDGRKCYFMKTGRGKNSEIMFRDIWISEGEYESLNAIHDAVPSLSPKAYAHGALEDAQGHYLVTDFIDFSANLGSSETPKESLAQKLARMHTTPAPEEYAGKFGFPVPTCCGATVQDNTWESSWPAFYGKRRLMHILAEGEMNNGADKELRWLVERTVEMVVPRLLGVIKDVKPVLVHGDLWSGNYHKGRIGDGAAGDMIFDASACYAHNEYEMGIMKMFGGFDRQFYTEYHKLVPKAEPVEEYNDRVDLYMLYHKLNHYALFGGSYRSSAIGAMRKLYGKYGETK
ncbi:hypothetical protein RUND412_000986 [Rhizina undulata]